MARIIKSIFNSNAILGDTEAKRRQSMMAAARGAQSQPYNQIGGAAAGLIGNRLRQELFPTMEEEASEIRQDVLKRVVNDPMFEPNKSPFATKQILINELTDSYRETNNPALLQDILKGSSTLAKDRIAMKNSFLEGQIKVKDLLLRTTQLEEAQAEQAARVAGKLFNQQDINAAEDNLRKEFTDAFKVYGARKDALATMITLSKKKTNQADIALMINYFKAGDPNSAVLTGEIDLGKLVLSLSGKAKKLVENLLKGDLLDDTQRTNLINAAAARYNENAMQMSDTIDNLTVVATNRGLNPQNIITQDVLGLYDFDDGVFLERNIEIPSPEQVQEEIKTQTPPSTQTPQDFNIDDDALKKMQDYGVGNDNALLFDQVEEEEEEDEFGGVV